MLPSALGAATAATAPPPRTACGKPAQAAGRARHTFYLPKLGRKFEPFSLLSGRASGRQRSDYEANRGRTAEMPAGRRNQAWRRSQAEGRPLAVVSDPALGGSASTRHRPPPTNGWTAPQLLTELRATLPTATPAQPRLTLHHQPVPTGSAGQHFPTRRTRWLTGWLAGSGDDSRSSTTSLECFS